jgi:predicted GNAT family acetyltransferase
MVNASRNAVVTEVRRNSRRSRYELFVDGDLAGIAEYRRSGTSVELPHTEILPSVRGRGFAGTLVRGALDDIRKHHNTVVPRCWFVAEFIDMHPEYQDLVAA